jgi:hypothetical protein
MKLKLLVTSMILASAANAAFADDQSMQTQLDAMKAQMAQMQATINNNGGGVNLPADSWFNRIKLSGMINVQSDVSSRSPTTFNQVNNNTVSNIAVPNANLFIDADVSDWTKAHLGFVYGQKMDNFNLLRAGAYTSSQLISGSNDGRLDEAYVTIGNFAKSPFYLKAGQQFLPFGDYNPYKDVTPSFTQVLSQVNDTGADVGFVSMNGFHGSVFGLDGIQKAGNNGDNVRNYGADLGFAKTANQLSYNLGVQYLRNMADVTGMRYDLGFENSDKYTRAVSALAANADVKFKAVDAGLKYVGAMNKFDPNDLSYNNEGARPAAWNVDAGYSFPVMNHDTRFGLGYQGTKEASAIVLNEFNGADVTMPRTRYLANYTFNVSKYTDVGFEFRHDKDYGMSQGGTGNSANTAAARIAVKFA